MKAVSSSLAGLAGGPSAIVVLGCRPHRGADGSLEGALGRRVGEAARRFVASQRAESVIVIASGGCRLGGVVEADAMANELVRLGVPAGKIFRDRCSLSTRENARYAALAMRRRGLSRAVVVTCEWHIARALAHFREEGIDAEGAPVVGPRAAPLRRAYRAIHERIALFLALAACFVMVATTTGCPKETPSAPPADAGAPPMPPDLAPLARAEDQRRARDVSDEARTSHDVATRRRAARALARIADPKSGKALYRALSDEDAETAAWGAFGLGAVCSLHKDPSEERVRALVARAASLDGDAGSSEGVRSAIARAVGHCGKNGAADADGSPSLAEASLASWLRAPVGAEAAAYALGDVAAKGMKLGDVTVTALLDVAQGKPDTSPLDAALYPFGRMTKVGDVFLARLLAVARAALSRPGAARIFAIRALARAGDEGSLDLRRVVEQKSYTAVERGEAAKALGDLRREGQLAAAEALLFLVPDKDAVSLGGLGGPELNVLRALLRAVGSEPPKKAEASLYVLARLVAPPGASPALARRIADLRCSAAGALARGSFDADVLKKCDDPEGEPYQRARLASLVINDRFGPDRRAAWVALAKSPHVRVREAAFAALAAHEELADVARAPLAEALASGKAGLAAAAAIAIHKHPERAFTLAASERRAALDPRAPAPSSHPSQEIDPVTSKALKSALATPWAEDLVETRMAIVDAAVALGMKEGQDLALALCKDANITVRQRATAALQNAKADVASCKPPDAPAPVAPELTTPLAHAVKLVFEVDAGPLSITLDPSLAPIAAARLASLARSGFYDGSLVHRVVAGFVAQLGDPGGDGYGGSGKLLRCETSPVPFGPLDVGIALAGRDTGSSQLFVTLSRSPHLDGEFTRVGHAEGDWSAVAEGDVIRAVKVEE